MIRAPTSRGLRRRVILVVGRQGPHPPRGLGQLGLRIVIMPSTPPDLLARLLKDVERASGMEITCTRDCEVLSEELRAFDGRFPVSVSTLRRCFGLIEAPGNFSQTTLNTLARYVGPPPSALGLAIPRTRRLQPACATCLLRIQQLHPNRRRCPSQEEVQVKSSQKGS